MLIRAFFMLVETNYKKGGGRGGKGRKKRKKEKRKRKGGGYNREN